MKNKTKYFLQINDISVGYQKRKIVSNVNMTVWPGNIIILLGPNGSGKSTILKSITKYLKLLDGTAMMENRNIVHMNEADFALKTAIVFTDKIKTELMTCEEVVAMGRYPHTGKFGFLAKEDYEKIEEAMELVKIQELRNQDFTQISDGQRQRVLLAKAICQEPKLIVLDEPTSFLDIRYKLELLEIIRKLATEKEIAVIASMHEIDLAQKIADYVLCIKDGKVICEGHADEIFTAHFINDLYDLNEGCYNEQFGSIELNRIHGKAKVFVIAGNGLGIEVYRKLQKLGIPFVTGILHRNDVDYVVANSLAVEIISEESFECIQDATYEKALESLKGCNRVINCLTDFGTINKRNNDLLDAAMLNQISVCERDLFLKEVMFE